MDAEPQSGGHERKIRVSGLMSNNKHILKAIVSCFIGQYDRRILRGVWCPWDQLIAGCVVSKMSFGVWQQKSSALHLQHTERAERKFSR